MTSKPEQSVVFLLQPAVLREELDRPVARAVDADLGTAHDAEPVLEADLRAAVEAEEILGEVTEIALPERTRKAMRDAERALVFRDAQRSRQIDEREVRLRSIRIPIRVVVGAGSRRFLLRRCDDWRRERAHRREYDESCPSHRVCSSLVIWSADLDPSPDDENLTGLEIGTVQRHADPGNGGAPFELVNQVAVLGVAGDHADGTGLEAARDVDEVVVRDGRSQIETVEPASDGVVAVGARRTPRRSRRS